MAKISKPMKLIALRIDEEEKARLEQLAEERDVTLSRALREGAAMYLSGLRAKGHRARGGDATFFGIRRDASGRTLNSRSTPTKSERGRVTQLRAVLRDTALGRIRASWANGGDAAVVLAAVGNWLSLVGHVYVSNESDVGWHWFLRDYCAPYTTAAAAEEVCREIRSALVRAPQIDVGALLDSLDAGFLRFSEDCEHQELVRRAVLPVWQVMENELSR